MFFGFVRRVLHLKGDILYSLSGDLSGSRALLVGFGKTGVALAKWLIKEGVCVSVYDKRKSEKEILEEAERNGCTKIKIARDGERAEIVFRSPGVSPFSAEIVSAVERGAVLSSETELFFERAKGKIYGVTGSDGKTTTTTLTGKILEKALENTGKRVFVGGNIGVPLISFLDELNENDVTVAELSSFQLITMRRSPHLAAITNISENHLDYHGSMTEYVDAKRRIFSGKECSELIINTKTLDTVKGKYLGTHPLTFPERITEISPSGEKTDLCYRDNAIFLHGMRYLKRETVKAPGFHNIENFMTAIGLTKGVATQSDVESVAEDFKGVEHRMELVCEKNGVAFFNSSIDSTPSRSTVTLSCFEKPLTVICGGYDKHLDYSEFAKVLLLKADNVIVTGASLQIIKNAIEKQRSGYSCKVYYEPDFEKAVLTAADFTREGGKVLLSPACASFDRFANFEERGNYFKQIVKSL